MFKKNHLVTLAVILFCAVLFAGCMLWGDVDDMREKGGDEKNNKTDSTYTVSFVPNGGTPVPSPQSVAANEKAREPGTMTKTGYTFVGWYEGVTKWNFASDTINDDIKLIAKWTANSYTVVYDSNGGSGTTSASTHVYDEPKALNPNAFIKTGFEFAGWALTTDGAIVYTDKQVVINLTAVANGTKELYARWGEGPFHTLTVSKNITEGGITTPASQQQNIPHDIPFSISATTTNDNYKFYMWKVISGNPDISNYESASTTVTLTADATVEAIFLKKQIDDSVYNPGSTDYPSFTFNNFSSKFPATVEVYALGAGGGGQGGHRWLKTTVTKCGTGGGGGGGAAAYMKLEVPSKVTFSKISVGRGGTGGAARSVSSGADSGFAGSDGGSTILEWNNGSSSYTLTVNGGRGGGEGKKIGEGQGQIVKGGTGGAGSSNPDPINLILNISWMLSQGGNGIDGLMGATTGGKGGNSGSIPGGFGYLSGSFGGTGASPYTGNCNYIQPTGHNSSKGAGGAGGFNGNNAGINGGDGQIIIYITHYKLP